MVEVLERDAVGETIDATVNYVVNNGEKLFTETAGPGGTDVRTGGTVDPHRVPIHNARLHSDPFVLDREGFRFVRHDTAVADFFDEDQVRRVYYPEMEALVKAESGASRVVVFDHTLRTADDEQREARKIREVVRRVHNDYTEWSGPQRVRDLLPQEADDLLQRRFAIVQVWRPIRHPVESFPLAICDARSIAPDGYYEWSQSEARKRPYFIHPRNGQPFGFAGLAETWIGPNGEELDTVAIVTAPASADLAVLHHRVPVSIAPDDFVVNERRYPNRIGQTYAITYNPEHRWYWLPRMRREEALVFKVYDSLKDGRARWSAHTAFDDPTSPPNARPRESIEIRTLAFF